MALTKIIFAALLCLPISIFSQIEIDGVLRLGDTAQVLTLVTKNGDLFNGSISSWGEGKLTFRMNTGNMLVFAMEELESINVPQFGAANADIDPVTGEHLFKWNDGEEGTGRLLVLSKRAARIKYDGNHRKYLKADSLISAVLQPGMNYPKYPNNYIVTLNSGKKIEGCLLSLDHEQVGFQVPGKPAFYFPRPEMKLLKYKKSYQPMVGHERALLLAPTGFGLRKNDFEYRNINYIINSFAAGLSDHLTGTVGLLGIEPYVQLKAAFDLSPYLHTSVSWGTTTQGARGWSTAVSVGTPDYYLNLGFMANKGKILEERTDMNAIFFGGSLRIDNRIRVVAEVFHLIEKESLLNTNGHGTNTFAAGFGWFSRRFSLNLGLLLFEESTCSGNFFSSFCNRDRLDYSGGPILSTTVKMGKQYKRAKTSNNQR
ncbi:MAG TPA: hypothetical protein ENJ95_01395 [Bacteroidetes bacterium]|nr:hypothetical protein [Bacteroidota bacterium]